MPIYEVKCPVCNVMKVTVAKQDEKITCTCGTEMVKIPSVPNLLNVG
jgi:ribosomal protein S27E